MRLHVSVISCILLRMLLHVSLMSPSLVRATRRVVVSLRASAVAHRHLPRCSLKRHHYCRCPVSCILLYLYLNKDNILALHYLTHITISNPKHWHQGSGIKIPRTKVNFVLCNCNTSVSNPKHWSTRSGFKFSTT